MEEHGAKLKAKKWKWQTLKRSGVELNASVMLIHEGMQYVTFSIRSLS